MLIKLIGGLMPETKKDSDAGTDLFASEDMEIPAHSRGLIPLGFCTQFPPDRVALIKDRSSLALRGYYTHAGVIDSSYRGEWKLIVENTNAERWCIKRGDKVAQVLFLPIYSPSLKIADNLDESERGTGGFGSTGR